MCVQLGSLRVFVYICVYIHGCICITHCKPLGLCLCLHIYKRLNLDWIRQPRCRWVYFCIHTSLHLYHVRHSVGCCLYLYTQCMLMCVSPMTSYVSLPVFVCTFMRRCVSTMASYGVLPTFVHICMNIFIFMIKSISHSTAYGSLSIFVYMNIYMYFKYSILWVLSVFVYAYMIVRVSHTAAYGSLSILLYVYMVMFVPRTASYGCMSISKYV